VFFLDTYLWKIDYCFKTGNEYDNQNQQAEDENIDNYVDDENDQTTMNRSEADDIAGAGGGERRLPSGSHDYENNGKHTASESNYKPGPRRPNANKTSTKQQNCFDFSGFFKWYG
jgi:hypothetical protein